MPKRIFDTNINMSLVHQAVVAQASNVRQVSADVKTRAEVRGGGRKPWRQKGTGRARHGSSRSPIWRGGGITFGPTSERNYSKKINKKMKQKALSMVLAQKAKDEELIVLDELNLSEPKTKEINLILKNIFKTEKAKPVSSVLIVATDQDKKIARASRNINKVTVAKPGSLNILDLVNSKYAVLTKEAVESIDANLKRI